MKAGWEQKRLSDVCQIKPPKAEARKKLSETDFVTFAPMEVLGIGQKYFSTNQERPLSQVSGSYTYFTDGDVLLAKITPCFENGKLGIARELTNGVGFGSSEFIVFRPAKELNQEYLYYYLNRDAFRAEGEKVMTGAVGHKRVPKEFIESYPIPLPPHPEQQRIVGVLDEAFEGIAKAKAHAETNLKNARELFESHLRSVFTHRDEGWIAVQLDALTEPDSPITYGVVKPGDDGDVRFVRGGDLVSGKVRLSQLRTITRAVSNQYRRTQLRGGELLICLVGQPGQVAVAPEEMAGANIARQVGLIRLKKTMNAEFVRYFLQSAPGAEALGARESGSVQQVINLGELRHLSVPHPQLVEQNKIVAKLDVMEAVTKRLEAIYRQKLALLAELKQSLLHQAFSGEL